MIIISHDRHFLNQVCTHMADMDYGTLKVYPGNYDDYMWHRPRRVRSSWPSTPRPRRSRRIAGFVRRFSANKSKARQATSRAKQIEKIKVEDIKPSSRQNPFVRFEGEEEVAPAGGGSAGHREAYDRTAVQELQHHGGSR